MKTKLETNNPQGIENTEHNLVLSITLLKAIRDKDFGYMLKIFPEGVEYKNYKFTTEEQFTDWDNYEEYTRYNAGAQDMMIKKRETTASYATSSGYGGYANYIDNIRDIRFWQDYYSVDTIHSDLSYIDFVCRFHATDKHYRQKLLKLMR